MFERALILSSGGESSAFLVIGTFRGFRIESYDPASGALVLNGESGKRTIHLQDARVREGGEPASKVPPETVLIFVGSGEPFLFDGAENSTDRLKRGFRRKLRSIMRKFSSCLLGDADRARVAAVMAAFRQSGVKRFHPLTVEA